MYRKEKFSQMRRGLEVTEEVDQKMIRVRRARIFEGRIYVVLLALPRPFCCPVPENDYFVNAENRERARYMADEGRSRVMRLRTG